jgi:hypothetical protein
VRVRLLANWPRADHAALVRLAEFWPSQARLFYDLILELDARPAKGAPND